MATDSLLYIVTVRPSYFFAACSKAIVYAFQSNEGCHSLMFWDPEMDERHVKASQPVFALAGHGLYTLAVTKAAAWGKYDATIFNSIGSPVDSRSLHFEPTIAALTGTHAVICSADVVYVWNFCSPAVRQSCSLGHIANDLLEPIRVTCQGHR